MTCPVEAESRSCTIPMLFTKENDEITASFSTALPIEGESNVASGRPLTPLDASNPE